MAVDAAPRLPASPTVWTAAAGLGVLAGILPLAGHAAVWMAVAVFTPAGLRAASRECNVIVAGSG